MTNNPQPVPPPPPPKPPLPPPSKPTGPTGPGRGLSLLAVSVGLLAFAGAAVFTAVGIAVIGADAYLRLLFGGAS